MPNPTTSVATLDSAARFVFKGSIVPLKIQSPRGQGPSRGLAKYGGIRALALAPGETDSVREHLGTYHAQGKTRVTKVSDSTFVLLRLFEAPVLPALAPNLAAVAVPVLKNRDSQRF